MPKKLIPYLLLLFLLTASVVWAAPSVPPVPNPASYVNDFAGLINPETAREIEAVAKALDQAAGAELVVVTVENLDGYPIEDYALELFRQWGLGDQDKNNGVLLLVNKENALSGKSGRVRIEVGYGLEGAIPDGKAGRILDDYVLPAWSQQDLDTGIYHGFMALAATIAEEYGVDLGSDQNLEPLTAYRQQTEEREMPFWMIILIIFFLMFLTGRSRSRRYYRGPFRGGFGGGGFGGFGGGGFGGGSSGGGGASR